MINISKLYCGLAGASDDLRYEPKRPHHPVAVYNCTARCNLKCLHCYSSSKNDSFAAELSTAQAKKLIAQLAEYGCPVVLFSGGEPLLRPDIFELIAYSRNLGMKTVVSTNGTLIDLETAQRLAALKLDYAGISLDGPQTQHDAFRGLAGSFDAAVRGIENCQKVGIKTGMRFTMTRQNIGHVESVFDIADNLGVRRVCFYHLTRTGRAAEMQNQMPSARKIREAMDVIVEKTDKFVANDLVDEVLTVGNHADGPYLLNRMNRQKHPLMTHAFNFLMAAGGNRTGQNIACINWDGNVFPDQFFRNYSLGNVMKESFSKIWENADDRVLHILRNKSEFKDPRCGKCKWFDLCRGNFRFLGADCKIENWRNEPPCYLTDNEIKSKA
jgi:radical SAM protein with 4Fe4S-binding SPASM domain